MNTPIRLTVIIPAYNEAKTIQQVLTQVLAQKEVFEVIVVDDASQDNTAQLAKQKKDKRLRVYSHTTNQGKGKAIQTALTMAKGNYILIQDADLEYNPKEIPILLEPIRSGRVEVVYGSRFFGARTNMYYWHYVGNQLLNLLINILYDTILSDMETCYKILPTQLMKDLKLTANDFRIEPEITCKLLLRGVKILEIPITYVGRSYAEGKKITGADWLLAVGAILQYRLSTV